MHKRDFVLADLVRANVVGQVHSDHSRPKSPVWQVHCLGLHNIAQGKEKKVQCKFTPHSITTHGRSPTLGEYVLECMYWYPIM